MRWVFWSAVVLIGYTYVGYPIWLWMRSRWQPRRLLTGANQPFVSIVMVVRNEEKVLERKMENLLALEALTVLFRLADYYPPDWLTGESGGAILRAAPIVTQRDQ